MRLLILLVWFLFGASVVAQSPSDKLISTGVNKKYLEHLIKTKIDSVRNDLGLSELVNNKVLYKAADYHSNWLRVNKKFSHYEKSNPSMLEPKDRVEYFGGEDYLVGENIVKSYINKVQKDKKGREYVNYTYSNLADDFVLSWVKSPGHYQNIITPEYEVTGVSISIDTSKGLIYAVQKFAKIPFKYEFLEDKEFFSYSKYTPPELINSFEKISKQRIDRKYPYRIKPVKNAKDSTKRCSSCNLAIDSRVYKDYFEKDGTKMNLLSFNVTNLEKVIQKRKDGFALEFISYEPYDCGNPAYYSKPSRRNNQYLLSDTVVIPVYKKDLKKGFKHSKYSRFFKIRKEGTADKFEFDLGRIPKELSGYYEVNIIVLQKRRICRVIHFSDYCGEDLAEIYSPEFMLKEFDYSYLRKPSKGKLKFTIPFEKGKYNYSYDDIVPLLGTFGRNDFFVDSISILAYSSLEGSESINRMLQTKRANSILSVFESNQNEEIKNSIISEPNWELFENQIKNEVELVDLKELDRSQIKSKLLDRTYCDKIEPFLAKQRIGSVELYVTFNINNLVDTLLSDVEPLIDSYRKFGLQSTKDSISRIQGELFKLWHKDNSNSYGISEVGQLVSEFPSLLEDHWWLRINEEGLDSLDLHSKYLTYWYKSGAALNYAETRFNLCLMQIQRLNQQGFIGDQNDLNLISNINNLKISSTTKDSLEIYAYSEMIKYFKDIDSEKKRKYCKYLLFKFQELGYGETEFLRLSRYYIWLDEDATAFEALSWFKSNFGFVNDESKILFSKLGYYHNKEYHNNNYHQGLINLFDDIENENWCGMFVGPCNISFQVFDYEPLRNFYCEKCGEYRNYGQSSELWND